MALGPLPSVPTSWTVYGGEKSLSSLRPVVCENAFGESSGVQYMLSVVRYTV